MSFLKTIAVMSALSLVATPAFAGSHADGETMVAHSEAAISEATSGTVITAKVNGLVCDFCAQALNKVFKKTDKVETVDVDLDSGLVKIALKPGQDIDDDTVQKMIRDSGYSFVSLERSSA